MTKIYALINKLNLKMYIGQTASSLSRRFSSHMSSAKHGSSPIYRAIRKYGKDAFEMVELATTDDREYGHFLERLCIAFYRTQGTTGYNASAGGEAPAFGMKHTKQWCKEHSKAMSGSLHPLFGTKVSDASKKKMSDSRKGRLVKPEISNELIARLYLSGLGTRAVADILHMARTSIQKRLKSQGVKKHPTGRIKRVKV